MLDRKAWEEFRETGLFWWINRVLHTFGWTVVLDVDQETGVISEAYPARTNCRGFSRQVEEEGFVKVAKYLEKNSKKLLKETVEEQDGLL